MVWKIGHDGEHASVEVIFDGYVHQEAILW